MGNKLNLKTIIFIFLFYSVLNKQDEWQGSKAIKKERQSFQEFDAA